MHAQERDLTETLDSLLAVQIHTAAQHAQSQADAPAAVTVITAEEITAFGARTLGEVLARVPGFHVSYDHNYTYIGVRGFGRPTDYNNRTLVLLDGQPLNESVYGGAPMGTDLGIDLGALQRIEVVRGPVSALYGGNAMIAVINLITRSPGEPGTAASVEGGSLSYVRASARTSARIGSDASLFASVFGGREDGADLYLHALDDGTDGAGVVRGRDWDRFAGGLAALNVGGFTVRMRASTRTKGIPTGAWFTDPRDERNLTLDRWFVVGAEYTRPVGARTALAVLSSYYDYRYEGTYAYPDDVLYDATDNRRLFALAQLRFDPSPARRWLVGVSVSDNSVADYITWWETGPTERVNLPHRVFGVFAQAELHLLPQLTLTAGGRLDAEEHQSRRITPRAALVTRPADGTTVKLLYGDAFRPPNVYERSFPSGDAAQRGGLVAERLRTGELVLEQKLAGGSMRVSVFTGRFSNLIDTTVEGDDEVVYENVGAAATEGLETEVTAPVGRWLLRTGGTVLHNRDADEQPLTNAPARMAVAGISGPLTGRLRLAVQLRAEASRVALDGSRAHAHTLVDTNLAFRPVPGLRASVRVTNLLDVDYAYPGGSEHPQVLIPQDGRRIMLRLEHLR